MCAIYGFFVALNCCKISFFGDLCYFVKNFLSRFTRFCVEKNWDKNCVCGEKRTNIMSDHDHHPTIDQLNNRPLFLILTLSSSSSSSSPWSVSRKITIKSHDHHIMIIIIMPTCSGKADVLGDKVPHILLWLEICYFTTM